MSIRREARRRVRAAHIADLERGVGLAPLEPELKSLPTITVRRRPQGEWFIGDRWEAIGFGYYDYIWASTRRGCVRKARRRLRAMVAAELSPQIEVKL